MAPFGTESIRIELGYGVTPEIRSAMQGVERDQEHGSRRDPSTVDGYGSDGFPCNVGNCRTESERFLQDHVEVREVLKGLQGDVAGFVRDDLQNFGIKFLLNTWVEC